MLAITMYLLPLTGAWVTIRTGVMALAVILTVVTGIDYAGRALAVRRRGNWCEGVSPVISQAAVAALRTTVAPWRRPSRSLAERCVALSEAEGSSAVFLGGR